MKRDQVEIDRVERKEETGRDRDRVEKDTKRQNKRQGNKRQTEI